eukprot:3263601-Alexandrium_andersonii.AAC.1
MAKAEAAGRTMYWLDDVAGCLESVLASKFKVNDPEDLPDLPGEVMAAVGHCVLGLGVLLRRESSGRCAGCAGLHHLVRPQGCHTGPCRGACVHV